MFFVCVSVVGFCCGFADVILLLAGCLGIGFVLVLVSLWVLLALLSVRLLFEFVCIWIWGTFEFDNILFGLVDALFSSFCFVFSCMGLRLVLWGVLVVGFIGCVWRLSEVGLCWCCLVIYFDTLPVYFITLVYFVFDCFVLICLICWRCLFIVVGWMGCRLLSFVLWMVLVASAFCVSFYECVFDYLSIYLDCFDALLV